MGKSTCGVVGILGLLLEVKGPVLSARLEIHLLTARSEKAKPAYGFLSSIAPEANADWFLTSRAVLLRSNMAISRDVSQVVFCSL